jgi:hypothetical protein
VGTNITVTVSGLTLGGLNASNYTLAQPTLAANITQAQTLLTLGASANPSAPTSNVTFTATLSVVAPGAGTPTGTIQFRTNGVALGTAAALSGGLANVSTALLSHGSNFITAEFVGGGNFQGSTSTLAQIVNTVPLAPVVTIERAAGLAFRLRISNLLTNCSDLEGDAVFFRGVSSQSTNAAIVTTNATFIFYTPPATNGDVTDSFNYTVGDTFGGVSTGKVVLTIAAVPSSQTHNILSLTLSNGTAILDVAGVAGRTYWVQATTNMASPNWQTIGTNIAGPNGLFKFFDYDAVNWPARSYRTMAP